MNGHILLLFFNAFLSMLLGALIVLWILRREYRPTIARLENEARRPHPPVADE